jgi:hypothetical protein
MLHPHHLPGFDHPNIQQRVGMDAFIIKPSLACRHFIPLVSNILLSTLYSNTLSVWFQVLTAASMKIAFCDIQTCSQSPWWLERDYTMLYPRRPHERPSSNNKQNYSFLYFNVHIFLKHKRRQTIWIAWYTVSNPWNTNKYRKPKRTGLSEQDDKNLF